MDNSSTQVAAQNNVLYEPAIYQEHNQEMNDHMVDTQSVSTIADHVSIVSNYKVNLDPSLFTAHQIRCCICGIMMPPNESNTCISCLKSSIDITEGITKSIVLYHCRECNRYLRPPWTHCQLESPELLSLCLKQVKGLKRVKLIDAGFVWTEPHSRRIKVKLTVQKEVLSGTLLQQNFVIDYIVTNQQCDDCKKTYTPHLWVAQVQVRQRVDHKRTFLFLEQLILKHNAAEKCLGIREMHDGLDFQFKLKSHANRLVEFIQGKIPCRFKQSKQLISHNEQSNIWNNKYTISVDIAPVCKDDLVILPKALSKELGGLGPMVLVYKITTFVHIVDVFTMRTYEVDQIAYWKHQFQALCGRDRLTEFIVLNIENTDYDVNVSRAAAKQKFKMVQVEVARTSDFGVNDKTFIVNTHLGELLNYNDTVLGFDLEQMCLMDLDKLENVGGKVPQIVLVKKTFPKFRKRQRHRIWKLKHLEKEAMDENNIHQKKDKNQNKHEKDYKMFIQDIEEDPEVRGQIDLYRNDDVINELERKLAGMKIEEGKSQIQKDLDKGSKKIGNKDRKVAKVERKTQEGKRKQEESEESRKKDELLIKATLKEKQEGSDEDGWESVEEDVPHIKLDELKSLEEQLAGMKIQGEGEEDEEDDEEEEKDNAQGENKQHQ